MKLVELLERLRLSIKPTPECLFLFTDPSYVSEEEWDEEMQGAEPFESAAVQYITLSYGEQEEFNEEEYEHILWMLGETRVMKGDKYGD